MMKSECILSITIPTFNRANYLKLNLEQLLSELKDIDPALVEIVVSDNASSDNTEEVAKSFIGKLQNYRYIRNAENIGSDKNIAQCYSIANGTYVVALGDDDLLINGAVKWIINEVKRNTYGVICIRPFGYDNDFINECPPSFGHSVSFKDTAKFLSKIGPLAALISACVINKSLLTDVDPYKFCGCSLVQVHLVILAAKKASLNLYSKKYFIAYKRNNWGHYDFSNVFVHELGKILDSYRPFLGAEAIKRYEKKLLLSYFPQYILKDRVKNHNISSVKKRFSERYSKNIWYYLSVYPILFWPKYIAIAWGAIVSLIGRLINGDGVRIFYFLMKNTSLTLKRQ
ncbi:glycosyltransferase involved in cell wall biosynthesis [Methylovorus glucosotrophus]|uniref:glycosyltransferase family 2 protein n=1 Tax=Methylovorus glucosotrophus TaxID=266009 RepID=UPI0013314DCE|nr:glycosyltransferase family 2 protein [Methylovorus glucosotrophus]KAF0835964.1 glycosyltransferase involved in cell wall biosynthesis [Methylovorus glucosotrophus]